MPARGVERRLNLSHERQILDTASYNLVDASVRGRLIGNTLKQFESFYLATPHRQEKVMLARSLPGRLSRTTAIV